MVTRTILGQLGGGSRACSRGCNLMILGVPSDPSPSVSLWTCYLTCILDLDLTF